MKFSNWKWWRREQSTTTLNTPKNQPTVDNAGEENEGDAGLKVLYNPTETDVDIVCVHGLGGHREATWTAQEPETGRTVFWIRDFLPDELPHARIMTYGYSSQVFSVRHLTQRTLYSQSKTLLTALKRSRRDVGSSKRPLIFISHSLGGLIVKSALIHADKDDVFNDILVCTAGVVFFGTPHQGTSDKSWTKIMRDLIQPTIDLNRMRNTLDSDLNWLQLQLEQYKSFNGFFPTYCLYEAETSQTNPRASTAIPHIAAIPLELLNTTTLLSPVSRRVSQENLCKFQRRDSEYHEVVRELQTIYKRARDLVSKNVMLDHVRRDPSVVVNNDGDAFLIPSKLPGRVTPFIGRDTELRAIYSCLSSQKDQHLVTLLGPPGIGKTQIALQYAHIYEKYYSSVFWVHAQNRFALQSSLLNFAQQLKNLYVGTSLSEVQLRVLYRFFLGGLIDEEGRVQSCHDSPELLFLVFRKWLERRGNDRWLLIVDGVDRETDLQEFQIDEFLDSPTSGHIIITSRSLRRGQTLDVHELKPDDAMALFCQTTRLDPDREMRDLVNKLERVPLAIIQAGAFLSSSQWPVHKYSQSLSSNLPPESEIATQSSGSPLPRAWAIAIQQLDKTTAELLDTIAFLTDNDISIEFIKSSVKKFPRSTPNFPVDESLTTLEKYCLIKYDSATQKVVLDSCMLEWLRQSKQDTPDYRLRAMMACWSVSSYLESAMAKVKSVTYTAKQYRLEEQLLPYIERCVNYIQVLSRKDADWGVFGDACRRQGRHDLARRYYDIAVSDYKQIPLRAEILLQDMHDMEHSLGPTHIRTLRCAALLASHYQEEGEHAKAEIIWRRANSSQSKTFGNFHPLTLKTAARLALTLQQQGKYSQAEAVYSSTCKATATVLGDDHPDSLRLMANIAVLCTLQRRFNEADEEYRRVLEKMEEILGRDHEDVKKVQMYMTLNKKQKRPEIGGSW
ncbi:hypothetical protein F4679DRAFT_559895 [Xylaria curta]|nr:hypothetical protein F4679DRAFT_559895 [Xylaria curta]